MNDKGQIGKIIMIAFGVIIALVLIAAISTTTSLMTDTQPVVNESISIVAAVDGENINTTYQFSVNSAYEGDWRASEGGCDMSGISFRNSSGDVWTVTTDYVMQTNGTFTLLNTANVNKTINSDNLTYVSYTFCDEGYNKDSSARSIASLILIFLGLALIAFVFLGIKNEWFK